MSTLSTFEVSFTNLSYEYFALPASYPVQPYEAQQLQPASYTQTKDQTGFVTVILPLPGNLGVELPETLQVTADGEEVIYKLSIGLRNNDGLDENGRLAMLSFSVEFPDDISAEGKWEVEIEPAAIATARGGKLVGKVVMDSNILP
jgi:hypothetical protein